MKTATPRPKLSPNHAAMSKLLLRLDGVCRSITDVLAIPEAERPSWNSPVLIAYRTLLSGLADVLAGNTFRDVAQAYDAAQGNPYAQAGLFFDAGLPVPPQMQQKAREYVRDLSRKCQEHSACGHDEAPPARLEIDPAAIARNEAIIGSARGHDMGEPQDQADEPSEVVDLAPGASGT